MALLTRDPGFLDGLDPLHSETVVWVGMRLHRRIYAWDQPVRPELISSSRAVVFRGASVVVVRDANGSTHVTPGGRLQNGESVEDAARREVLEECGWKIGTLRLFALLHYQHLTPKPEGYGHQYPHFLQLVHAAEGRVYHRHALLRQRHGEIETGSSLVRIKRAFSLIGEADKVLLRQAVKARE